MPWSINEEDAIRCEECGNYVAAPADKFDEHWYCGDCHDAIKASIEETDRLNDEYERANP